MASHEHLHAWVGEYTIVRQNVILDGRGKRGRMNLLGCSCPFSCGLGLVQCFCVCVLTLEAGSLVTLEAGSLVVCGANFKHHVADLKEILN